MRLAPVIVVWLVAGIVSPGIADPLRLKAGLVSLTFYEQTGGTRIHTYAVGSAQLTVRLADPLTSSNSDFLGAGGEYYDVFYSDAEGRFDLDGEFVSVEAVYGSELPAGGALNICEVQLDFADSTSQFGCYVASFVSLGNNGSPGSAPRAADQNLGTWTSLGNTVGQTQRLRVTVGFAVVPRGVGWTLRARKDLADPYTVVHFNWDLAPAPVAGEHYNVYRTDTAAARPYPVLSTDPALVTRAYTDTDARGWLLFYEVFTANCLEQEATDP